MNKKGNVEIYNAIKNMTLEEIASIFNSSEKREEDNVQQNKITNKTLYTIDELIEKYPFFTRYNINKAIQRDGLPYCTIGNKRLFDKTEIEKWLEKETTSKTEKIKYKI